MDIPLENIKFEHVGFTYGNGTTALENISLQLEGGKHYALVGKNGSGKSSLIKLLSGLYDDYSGQIFYNQIEIRDIPLSNRKSLCEVIHQEMPRYQLSIAEILNPANPDVPDQRTLLDESIDETLRQLGIDRHTVLGKIHADGSDVSDGQWQRLMILRATMKNPQLFIFDEPASAIDAFAERELYHKIKQFSEIHHIATLYVTHRLSAAKNADEIIVLDEGRLIAKGTHPELLENCELYREMYERQRRWYMEKGTEL